MGSARAMAIMQIHNDALMQRKAAHDERIKKTAEVTRVWKEEFGILVDGRNESAKNLKEAFGSASQMTYERESEMWELLEG